MAETREMTNARRDLGFLDKQNIVLQTTNRKEKHTVSFGGYGPAKQPRLPRCTAHGPPDTFKSAVLIQPADGTHAARCPRDVSGMILVAVVP